jgi:hypothetical protein
LVLRQAIAFIAVIVWSAADAFAGAVASTPLDVPALSEWGMLTAAGGFMLLGIFFVLYRKRTVNVQGRHVQNYSTIPNVFLFHRK